MCACTFCHTNIVCIINPFRIILLLYNCIKSKELDTNNHDRNFRPLDQKEAILWQFEFTRVSMESHALKTDWVTGFLFSIQIILILNGYKTLSDHI